MTAAELRKAEARYVRAFAVSEVAKRERDAAIRAAHGEGMTTRQIAEVVSVSHQRVAQIVKP
jgi:DNA-directed RNA polymerase specialized sigma subunit